MYKCEVCNYSSDDKSNYVKHTRTNNHKWAQEYFDALGYVLNTDAPEGSDITLNENSFYCPHCQKILSKQHKRLHLRSCASIKQAFKDKQLQKKDEEIKSLNTELIVTKKDLDIKNMEIRLVKVTMEKDAEIEKLKQQLIIEELKKQLELSNKAGNVNSNNGNNKSNNKNSNNKTISYIFIKNNYTDAPVYKDVMQTEISATEKKALKGLPPTAACAKLISHRCINDIEMENRPLHCLDLSRNKFAVRIRNKGGDPKWKIDQDGEHILTNAYPIIKTFFPIKNVNDDIKLKNKIGLQKMMTPFDKKKILRELGRLGHVDASETLK